LQGILIFEYSHFENTPEAKLKSLKTQEGADLQMARELSFEAPKPKKANKVPLGQYESPLNLQPMPLAWFVEECPDFKEMIKEQSIAVRQDANLIDNIMKSSKSFGSWINDAKAKKDLHPLIIMKIIAKIESLQARGTSILGKVRNRKSQDSHVSISMSYLINIMFQAVFILVNSKINQIAHFLNDSA
jgi:hypothetical protein